MKKLKKAVSLTMAGLLAAGLLGGCGGGQQTSASGSAGTDTTAAETKGAGETAATGETTAAAAPEGDVAGKEIKIWISSGAEDDIYREMFREIEGGLGLTVKDEYYSKDELDSKMQVSGIAGDMPDVIVADYLLLPNYVDAEMIAPIDQYLPADIKSDMLPSVVDEATYNGNMYAVAQFDGGLAMWANKSMLDAAGVTDIPTSYKDAWTKEEFEDVLAKLKASGVEYPLYVRQNNPSTMYYTYFPIIKSFGGDYAHRDTLLTEGALNGEGTKNALEYLKWMIDQGYVNATCDYDDAFETRQESAIALLGHWKYTAYAAGIGEDNIVCIPIPDFGGGVYTCSGSTVWAMTTGAVDNDNAAAAWAVMEQVMEPDYIKKVVEVNAAIPSRKSVLDSSPDYQEGGKFYLYREQLEGGISYLRPFTSAHMTIYAQMKSVYGDIFAGADPSASLDSAAEAIDEIIVENGWDVK
ncbi:MAG: extracellular solute-binding protein [Hungatella sp.]|nr:extracellular solute-binding protein [Hungatella sp.]